MSRRSTAKAPGKGIVVLAGESSNDRRILASFIKAVHPDLASAVLLTEITDPVRLRKKTDAELATAAGILMNKARGKAKLKNGDLVGIAVHEDMDACPGPAYDSARRAVSSALAKAAGACESVYALAAAESEAWLLLFPDAFTLHRPSWKVPASWQGKDTGRRRTPKEDLEAEFGSPRFRESDGPEIAAKALAQGLLTQPRGSNRSYSEFVLDLSKWPVPRRIGR
ncbi:hypothetical protein PV416_16095 [Streptomyces ipomoeae]|uniref:DUF4276 family protein n=1 Tax=Streptomyces ipomoeae 91-03 TaxID=698759 RepID=L1KRY9_9ACTN|nr:hypothetical protein [Streptomyces ipomoeae]EKX63294.1 hypothetical protein STRIP9103_05106 [Streptomyces ipomoeae 91-03]MDX2698212.1 hypothetical protein [Streptomyces ipomoeae]MDX2822589.1 hypothetical protein [Streptomyces ipomoeae]MDX2842407.1 hypothetical protein [Streptomyces ipomoeae]MDX2876843.1 hypothetical protein [Streptomyces ipomoeae]